jgi:hypothetical protein
MAEVFDGMARRALGVEAFFAQIAAIEAPRFSADHIAGCARLLAELACHDDLIWDHLAACRGVAGWNRAMLGANSFLLAMCDHAMLRANVWSPIRPHVAFRDHERALHGYDVAHNHDFHLLSVGFCGPGAATELYRFDPDTADGSGPQPVALEPCGTVALSKGRVIYYEKYADVHVQRPPAELSISINLVFRHEIRDRDQLVFDVERSQVIGVAPLSRRVLHARFSALADIISGAQAPAHHHTRGTS